jgi:hypothetical protein
MIDIFFVLDGQRDHVTVPPLVGRILGLSIRAQTTHWARVRQKGNAKGYQRQLQFAIRQAQDAKTAGLVAVVDRDSSSRREKLKDLIGAREQTAGYPVALGQADPHGEAWLLDDPVAIRRGLGFTGDTEIPNIRDVESPKDTIEQLRKNSERSGELILDVLQAIVQHVDPSRFRHAKETGFEAFEKDVKHQLKNVATACGEECRCGDACG